MVFFSSLFSSVCWDFNFLVADVFLQKNGMENAYGIDEFLLFHFKCHGGLISFYYCVAQISGQIYFRFALDTHTYKHTPMETYKCCFCYAVSGWQSVRLLIRHICFRLLIFFCLILLYSPKQSHTYIYVLYFIIFFLRVVRFGSVFSRRQENIILHIFND